MNRINQVVVLAGVVIASKGLLALYAKLSKRFAKGVVLGRFNPPYVGDSILIEKALALCSSVTVAIRWGPLDAVSREDRLNWIQQFHPKVENVVLIEEASYNPADPEPTAKVLENVLGFTPNALFSLVGETDAPVAAQLKAESVVLDFAELTALEASIQPNPYVSFDLIHPDERARFSKVISIVGVESTGKTVLANRLAMRYFGAALVNEQDKEILQRLAKDRSKYTCSEALTKFLRVAEAQSLAIEAHRVLSPLVITDTNALSVELWYERCCNRRSNQFREIFRAEPDLYLVCDIKGISIDTELANVTNLDGKREKMHDEIWEQLKGKENVIVLSGSYEDRFIKATKEIARRFPELVSSFGDAPDCL